MKKIKGLCLVLALVLALQCLCPGVFATEVEPSPTETVTEATEAATETSTESSSEAPTVDPDAIPDVPQGADPGVEYGCNTIEAKLPLAGSDKVLRSARGVFVYETQSDTVLYGYNHDKQFAPGGLVQILNALVALENCDLDEVVTVSTYYINQLVPLGVRHQELRNGEEVTVRDLLYCMMLSSANDAAVVLAHHIAGDPDSYIAMMNDRAAELGCTDTLIKTVSGLDVKGQYTTARDMARIIQAAMELEEFRTIYGAGTYTVPATNLHDARELTTLNYLTEGSIIAKFNDDRVTGGKASYTSADTGAVIGFTAENDDLSLICVILGATRQYAADGSLARYGNFEEARELMKYCFDNFRASRMLYKGQSMLQMEVRGGANDVVAVNKSDLDIVLPKGVGVKDLKLQYEVEGGGLTAPLEEGQQITTMRMWYKGRCVGETTLYAQNAVDSADEPGFTVQDAAARSDDDMAKMLLYVGGAILVLVVLAMIYLGINAARRAAARKRALRKRRQQREVRMQRRRGY